MRFTAPPHASSVDLTSGPVDVINGVVTVADDLSPGELAGLASNGFTPLADALPSPAPTPAPKAKDSDA